MTEALEGRLAELAVRLGANVQPDQVVIVLSEPGKEALARAVAEAAYRQGARFVDVDSFDPHVKRARLRHATVDTLEYVPPWYGERMRAAGAVQAAVIALTGEVEPGLMDGIDPDRLRIDRLPNLPEDDRVIGLRQISWTVVPCPTPGWAGLVHPELGGDEALARLREEIVRACRLDEPDPVAAWEERLRTLDGVAERLDALALEAVTLTGPGTELTVGLLPGSRWMTTVVTSGSGIVHVANLPTEEIATVPDPERVDGYVTATRPLQIAGSTVTGLRLTFEAGRAVAIDADEGAGAVRALAAHDPGAARLGELALIDGDSRVAALDTIFHNSLLDENAGSRIALGRASPASVDGFDSLARINDSAAHLDIVVGSPSVDATGLGAGGEVALLRGGVWRV
jgi:aminopeptidase